MNQVKMWTTGTIEDTAREQIARITQLPILAGHIAIMPDVHWGKGATVGSVIPTEGAIIPAAVGVDIGCGMCAVALNIYASDLPDSLSELRSNIEASIPVGFSYRDDPIPSPFLWNQFHSLLMRQEGHLEGLNLDRAEKQLGTLGGGNHFIEVCLDETSRVWLMLHSGSRNVGKTIADIAINWAKEHAANNGLDLPDQDLAWLVEDSFEFKAYVEALQWAQDYAAINRSHMMSQLFMNLVTTLPNGDDIEVVGEMINCHHNYASFESHFNKNMWITRKGAVDARAGQMGIIPGSMGSRSYIVKGKGNPDSYCSCSHGAGRRLSRGAAKRMFTVEDLASQTYGIECRKDEEVLDEIPAAYKDIDEVMAAQDDLIEKVHTLRQVLCVKG